MADRTGVPNSIPIRYVGPQTDIVPIKRFPRRPLTTDKKYPIGQLAILGPNPQTGVQGELWYLSKFSGGDAIWLQFGVGAGQPGIDFILTDDGPTAVGPDTDGIVTMTGSTGLTTSGQDPSTTVTINLDTSVVTTQYDADSGSATPTAGVINVLGGDNITTSAASNNITIDLDANIADTYTGDSGTATPAMSNINILGGDGITTSASGSTVTIDIDNWVNVTSWTPTIDGSTSGTVTTTTASGAYARVGPLVILQFELAWTSIGSASGNIVIGNIPVAPQGAFNREPLGTIWVESLTWPTNKTYCVVELEAGNTTASVWGIQDNSVPSRVQLAANGTLHGTVAYIKSS